MSTYVNFRGVGGQNRAKNGQRSLRMTPYKVEIYRGSLSLKMFQSISVLLLYLKV